MVFARGTGEPVGPGGPGQAFFDSLTSQLPGKTVNLYPVNYPSTTDYANSAKAGAVDEVAHVQGTVASCPKTKVVIGGYSQGAGVADLTSHQLSPQVANHVAAVALFGNPQSSYAKGLADNQIPALDQLQPEGHRHLSPQRQHLRRRRHHHRPPWLCPRCDQPGRDVRSTEALALLLPVGIFARLNTFRLAQHLRGRRTVKRCSY